MSDMRESESTSTLFGGNAPFIEEQYENYLANPAAVAADWRAYFDSLRGGAADVAHAPVIESFIRLGKSKRVAGAMVDATTMHKQVLVLQMIGRFRTLGMFHADLDPLKRQEKPYIADLDLSTYDFNDADLDTEFDVGSFMGGTPRMRLRDLICGAARHLLPHAGRRVHVHQRHGDQALRPAARRADPFASGLHPRAAAPHPRAADRRGDAGALPPHATTSARSGSRARAARP